MQIVSNTCVGARIYQCLSKEFDNPFMWNVIPYEYFLKLCTTIRELNFKDTIFYLHNTRKCVVVDIDGIQIHFIHHKENSKYNVPTRSKTSKTSNDILCKDIINRYFKSMFMKRAERMDEQKGFIFVFDSISSYIGYPRITDKNIKDFINCRIDSKDKKILITENENYLNYNKNNLLVIKTNSGNT